MDWYSADLHLGHGSILKFCNRPYLSDEEQGLLKTDPRGRWKVSQQTVDYHDECLIGELNKRVQASHRLIIIGDFCWGGYAEARRYLDRIKCKNVWLVSGNHDKKAIFPLFRNVIVEGEIKGTPNDIYVHHRPQRSWYGSFDGVWHLYGHVHSKMKWEDEAEDWMLTMDVGVDAVGYVPLSTDDVAKYMTPRIPKFLERRQKVLAGEKLRFTW